MSSPGSGERRPYRGSCHCGLIRYIAFFSLPPNTDADVTNHKAVRFYKCNCTFCLKADLLHTRLPNAPRDFYLLSPSSPSDLSNYKCNTEKLNFYFCPTCGVRCFQMNGTGKTDEVELEVEPGKVEKTKVWRFDEEHWPEMESVDALLSINAVTLEPEDGLDLRELVDKKWLRYGNYRTKWEGLVDQPYPGGTW